MAFKKGHKVPKEWRDKISIKNKGRRLTKETKRKISIRLKREYKEGKRKAFWKDKQFSKEHKKNLSIGGKKKKFTQVHKKNISKGNLNRKKKYGYYFSTKVRKKMSETHKGLQIIGKKHPRYGKSHSKKAIEKIREARAKQIFPVKDTKIERKIQRFLKALKIEFFTHQYMKDIEHGYQCDILIPSMNAVIECDGDYWHKYPIGRDIDHIRTKELIEKGFKVLRLWEFEIRAMDINQFNRRLKWE